MGMNTICMMIDDYDVRHHILTARQHTIHFMPAQTSFQVITVTSAHVTVTAYRDRSNPSFTLWTDAGGYVYDILLLVETYFAGRLKLRSLIQCELRSELFQICKRPFRAIFDGKSD